MTYEEFWKPLTQIYDAGEAKAITRLVAEVRCGLTLADLMAGKEMADVENTLQKLLKGEPVQYVLGVAEFGPHIFHVAPGVLIPRPETYELCQWIVSDLSPLRILDIGTGSGCIACTLAAEIKGAEVTAWDISEEALQIARENAKRTSVHVSFEQVDVLNAPSTLHPQPSTLHPSTLTPPPLTVTLSVPNGAEVARRTFNPRLGIEGGISIIGVSGIVKPFSEEAFIQSIRKCMQVAVASGSERVVINSGGKSERFVKALYPDLPQQAFVEYGNYVGETLKIARELGVRQLTLGLMLGKAVKLAEGQLDTHSRRATMNRDFIRQMLVEAHIDLDLSAMTLARELWTLIPSARLQSFVNVVITHCQRHCQPLLPDGELTILLISDEGQVFVESKIE